MDLKRIIIEALIGFVIFHLIYFRFLKKQMKKGKGKRYMWGIYLTVLGVILTSIGLFITVISVVYHGRGINSWMIAGIAPFLFVGIPSLIIDIFFIHNP